MKNYRITVNGNVYDVSVEETAAGAAPAPAAAAPVRAAAAAAVVHKAAAAAPGGKGAVKVEAPMIGKILGIKAEPGQAVKKGQPIIILEAMKMENEIVAPEDGTVATIDCHVGDQVESGAVLATLN